ncbi:MAG: hypothetical protein CXR30_19375 [Geobacter sp.]|nr:MAG: hypothetical protein CXR30_19375 [Geobacter sp.]
MKIFLYIIVVLSYLGAGISTVMFARNGLLTTQTELSFAALIVFNSCCARYLYKKADKNKTEWALFGLIGNLTAIICYWLFKDVLINWRRGKRNFS